jgi:hypothetical protein
MQIQPVYSQLLFAGALSLHSATGLNAKFCLGLELLFVLLLFQASIRRGLRPKTAPLVALAIRAWLTATLGMMLLSYALLALNFR